MLDTALGRLRTDIRYGRARRPPAGKIRTNFSNPSRIRPVLAALFDTIHKTYDDDMSTYYYSKTLDLPMDEAEERVREELQKEGFGVLTEIDVKATLKKKLDVEFPPYKILGACNPSFAHKALQQENKIGTMLPCNVIVQERSGKTEVAAVDPIASMQAVDNEGLEPIAAEVRDRLRAVIDRL